MSAEAKRPTFHSRFAEVVADAVNVAAEAGDKFTGRPRDDRAAELEDEAFGEAHGGAVPAGFGQEQPASGVSRAVG
ncbi:hypothetical protein ABZZ79_33955 [Streptomyces sp. NPDC006458]|uniref:hypothetical protein n=1 Tax=Streptomyces sp. NPDC006458 TaxID=3154302 RepID=UPI0033BA8B46